MEGRCGMGFANRSASRVVPQKLSWRQEMSPVGWWCGFLYWGPDLLSSKLSWRREHVPKANRERFMIDKLRDTDRYHDLTASPGKLDSP